MRHPPNWMFTRVFSLHFLEAKEVAGWKQVALPLQLYHKDSEVKQRCFQHGEEESALLVLTTRSQRSPLVKEQKCRKSKKEQREIGRVAMLSSADREDATTRSSATKRGQSKGTGPLGHGDVPVEESRLP